MKILSIDIETYSNIDLTKSGVYAYSEDEEFEILLLAYAFDDEDVRVVDLKIGEKLPSRVEKALTDENVIKTAFNANFERVCIERFFKLPMEPEQWKCTAVLAATLGLPSSLKTVAEVLNLPIGKMEEGKDLIRFFSIPSKRKNYNSKYRNLPHDAVEKWQLFTEYCGRDVEVERAIRQRLQEYDLTPKEQKLWCLDQRINDYGIRIEQKLVDNIVKCNKDFEESKKEELKAITGIYNPNSVTQLKNWLYYYGKIEVTSLNKDTVSSLINETENESIKKVLSIRRELSKTSVKKYEAIKRALSCDGRVRGLIKFYGANRTGRWSGKLVQIHNLPQNKLKDLVLARELALEGKMELMEMLFESVQDVYSQLVRTAFIPRENCRFIVSDFSAIEARIVAWLANESWRLKVFSETGKIYEASAAKMFNVPLESITKDSPLRQKGKIAELALGYGGSFGALSSMGATKMGLSKEEIKELVKSWRETNIRIVDLWWKVERAAIKAVKEKKTVIIDKGISFFYEKGVLFVKLPSRRKLAYVCAKIEKDGKYNKETLTYKGAGKGKNPWTTSTTYGGKLVENIVQAIARDCLAEAMLRLDAAGYKIVMHVHDEVVLEVPNGRGSLEEVNKIMTEPIEWAEGLSLDSEGFESLYYRK